MLCTVPRKQETSLLPLVTYNFRMTKQQKRGNQCSLEWTEQYTQVGTVSRHMLRDICEDSTKEGGGHNVRSRKDTERVLQTDG